MVAGTMREELTCERVDRWVNWHFWVGGYERAGLRTDGAMSAVLDGVVRAGAALSNLNSPNGVFFGTEETPLMTSFFLTQRT